MPLCECVFVSYLRASTLASESASRIPFLMLSTRTVMCLRGRRYKRCMSEQEEQQVSNIFSSFVNHTNVNPAQSELAVLTSLENGFAIPVAEGPRNHNSAWKKHIYVYHPH